MKIGSFWFEDKSVNFKAFLKNSFSTIKEKQVKTLLIDLRDNEGGKDSYGALLYSYLTDTSFNYFSRITTITDKKFSFSTHVKQHGLHILTVRNCAGCTSRNNGIRLAWNVNAAIKSSTGSRAGGAMNIKNAGAGSHGEVAL